MQVHRQALAARLRSPIQRKCLPHIPPVLSQMVIGDFREARAERKRLLHGAFNGFAVPVDVQLYTRDEFESEARDPASFAATVRRQGVRLHL